MFAIPTRNLGQERKKAGGLLEEAPRPLLADLTAELGDREAPPGASDQPRRFKTTRARAAASSVGTSWFRAAALPSIVESVQPRLPWSPMDSNSHASVKPHPGSDVMKPSSCSDALGGSISTQAIGTLIGMTALTAADPVDLLVAGSGIHLA